MINIRHTNFPFPAYNYVSGISVHPKKQNMRHLPELPKDKELFSEDKELFSEDNWQKSERYLYAVDLFNFDYFWEAHEVLESLWIECGRTSDIAFFLQGMIQISAAMLKLKQGNRVGARQLYEKAKFKFSHSSGLNLGFDVGNFLEDAEGKIQF